MKNSRLILIAACGLVCLQGCGASGNAELVSRLEALDARLAHVERQLDIQPQANPGPQSKSTPTGDMPAYMNGALWDQLSAGMSRDVVRGILGEPSSTRKVTSPGTSSDYWEYKNVVEGAADGFVHFDAEGGLSFSMSPSNQ